MRSVIIKLILKPVAGPEIIEGEALLCDTNADTLRLVVETLTVDNGYDMDCIGWECFFYDAEGEDRFLVAYLSDEQPDNQFKTVEDLKYHRSFH